VYVGAAALIVAIILVRTKFFKKIILINDLTSLRTRSNDTRSLSACYTRQHPRLTQLIHFINNLSLYESSNRTQIAFMDVRTRHAPYTPF
jgi:hypothetical protein